MWIARIERALLIAVSAIVLPMTVGADVRADEGDASLRYGIPRDATRFSQDGPQQTIRSMVKALDDGKIAYMLAHLISPEDVDAKLKGEDAALRRLADKATGESTAKLRAALVDHLRSGRWIIKGSRALSEVKDRADLTLERVDSRWYLHNVPRQKTTAQARR